MNMKLHKTYGICLPDKNRILRVVPIWIGDLNGAEVTLCKRETAIDINRFCIEVYAGFKCIQGLGINITHVFDYNKFCWVLLETKMKIVDIDWV